MTYSGEIPQWVLDVRLWEDKASLVNTSYSWATYWTELVGERLTASYISLTVHQIQIGSEWVD